jgi:hypothetical protein
MTNNDNNNKKVKLTEYSFFCGVKFEVRMLIPIIQFVSQVYYKQLLSKIPSPINSYS